MAEETYGAAEVGAGFGQTAGAYDDLLRHNQTGARRLIDSLPDGTYESVVDVGCGTGFATFAIHERFDVKHALGVDPSHEMLAVMRESGMRLAPDLQLQLLVGDAAALPTESASADAIISTMAFHWFPDKEGAVREMARTVRPGGHVAILTAGRGTDAELLEIMRGMDPPVPAPWTGVFDYIHRDVREIEDLLEGAGLETVDIWAETRRRRIPAMDYLARLQAVASHLSSGLDPVEAEAHGLRLGEALAAASGPKGFDYTFVKLFAIARKPD